MQRISSLPIDTTNEAVAPLFSAIRTKMGGVPNILRTMAQSPVALEAYLGFSGALSNGRFTDAQRELIALLRRERIAAIIARRRTQRWARWPDWIKTKCA